MWTFYLWSNGLICWTLHFHRSNSLFSSSPLSLGFVVLLYFYQNQSPSLQKTIEEMTKSIYEFSVKVFHTPILSFFCFCLCFILTFFIPFMLCCGFSILGLFGFIYSHFLFWRNWVCYCITWFVCEILLMGYQEFEDFPFPLICNSVLHFCCFFFVFVKEKQSMPVSSLRWCQIWNP